MVEILDLNGKRLYHGIENTKEELVLNLVRKSKPLLNADLKGLNFENRNLSFTDFRGSDFRECNLNNTLFIGSNLGHCDFRGTSIKESILYDAIVNNIKTYDLTYQMFTPDGNNIIYIDGKLHARDFRGGIVSFRAYCLNRGYQNIYKLLRLLDYQPTLFAKEKELSGELNSLLDEFITLNEFNFPDDYELDKRVKHIVSNYKYDKINFKDEIL